jgi:glycosyltransferase involved in cell wall biosynthesis
LWTRSRLGSAILYGLLPHYAKFRILLSNLIPAAVKNRISTNQYDLILFNDHHFLPWLRDKRVFTREVVQRGIHLDIHEYVRPRVPRDSLWRIFAAPYYDWVRTFIGDERLSTRSTVALGISRLYVDEFGIPPLSIVRSAPAFVEQGPSPVDPAAIQLVYHGAANDLRGIPEMLSAMERVSPHFLLTLILVGDQAKIEEYRRWAHAKNLRVNFVEPVPVEEIAAHINRYDVEVMFFPPRNRNLEFALPNKLFEALQGRLALLMGESSMMAEVVREYSNGIITAGWSSEDLAAGIESLTAESVTEMKANSDRAARAISAESERAVFFSSIKKVNS